MKLQYEEVESWPLLAWLAVCERGSDRAFVRHGSHVETHDEWFCEAVWPGEFSAGEFDQTDLVVGTGGRLRHGRLVFVSSGTTVDRLQSLQTASAVLVSNSLPCLLECAAADVDPSYPRYYEDFRSVVNGLRKYKRTLETAGGPVRLTYFQNLAWDGQALATEDKPYPVRQFERFELYRRFLGTSVDLLARNAGASGRAHPFRPLGTVSTGYDSPAVATLCREAGLDEAVTFRRARDGEMDDGGLIAERLGLRVIAADRDAWRAIRGAPIPFCATNAYGEEIHYAALGKLLSGRVLFTGYHGDKVWAKDTNDLSPDIVRGDPTGLSLSEYRLWVGFLHCPLPYFGVRQIADINRISNSPAMSQWNVSGDYSRPIPRRIAEEAGVPRELFGVRKRASSVVLWNRAEGFLPPSELADLTEWIARHEGNWARQGIRSPLARKRRERLESALAAPLRPLHALVSRVPVIRTYGYRFLRLDPLRRPDPLFACLFPWALARAKERYRIHQGSPGALS